MRSENLRSIMRVICTSFCLGSRGRRMSRTTPTVTPLILTGFPSASPVTLSNRTWYSFLRAKIFCSEPMKNKNTISTSSALETSSPTRIVLFWVVVDAMVFSDSFRWLSVAVRRLRGGDGRSLEEIAEERMVGVPRFVDRADPLEHPAVEEGDAVADGE